MAHNFTLVQPEAKLLPAHTKTTEQLQHLFTLNHFYTLFAFFNTVILICLALRFVFALFLITGVVPQGITVITNPLIAPFATELPDYTHMIQLSTLTTFTAYFFAYWIVSKLLGRAIRHSEPNFIN